MIDTDLLTALLAVIDTAAVSDCTRVTLRASALTLAQRPNLAADLGLVLTEHTAPAVAPAAITVHPFIPSSPHRILCMAPAPHAGAGMCSQFQDAPAHRVESLADGEREALELVAEAPYEEGEHTEAPVFTTLILLGLANDTGDGWVHATTRGLAWLEAHPQDGEPS